MNSKIGANIKELMLSLRDGEVVTAGILRNRGYSYEQIKGYLKAGYLASVGRGAYFKPGAQPSITSALETVKNQDRGIHIGGRSALAQYGFVHFARMGEAELELFAGRSERLPGWFESGFADKYCLVNTEILPIGLCTEEATIEGFVVCRSKPERAILELIYEMPKRVQLNEAAAIMEMLTNLRPELVTDLLAACKSVKVKRLFLCLADRLSLPWLERIDLRRIDLGKGCRVVTPGGKYDAKWNLVIGEVGLI